MEYMRLNQSEREFFLASLEQMADYLTDAFSSLSPEEAQQPGPDGLFSPVEQVWHLTDLEREGFQARINRLLSETNPTLPDFNGSAVAKARNYRSLSLSEGLAAFADARKRSVELLKSVDSPDWFRSGVQEGVGNVTLCDMPSFMAQHDQAHRAEIEVWKQHA
ncbi:MAG TPA: DinB family protein [Blastocatellia bacterium]|nr:DinB family protein [Blastocatellia bacterium]